MIPDEEVDGLPPGLLIVLVCVIVALFAIFSALVIQDHGEQPTYKYVGDPKLGACR